VPRDEALEVALKPGDQRDFGVAQVRGEAHDGDEVGIVFKRLDAIGAQHLRALRFPAIRRVRR